MTFSAGGAIEFGQRMLQVASQGTGAWLCLLSADLTFVSQQQQLWAAAGRIQIPASFRLQLELA